MGRQEDANRLADDLESLQTGALSPSEFQARLQNVDERVLNGVWHGLQHYLADFDIRARDSGYRAMQDSEMEKLVRLLRAGASEGELAKIHFLGYS